MEAVPGRGRRARLLAPRQPRPNPIGKRQSRAVGVECAALGSRQLLDKAAEACQSSRRCFEMRGAGLAHPRLESGQRPIRDHDHSRRRHARRWRSSRRRSYRGRVLGEAENKIRHAFDLIRRELDRHDAGRRVGQPLDALGEAPCRPRFNSPTQSPTNRRRPRVAPLAHNPSHGRSMRSGFHVRHCFLARNLNPRGARMPTHSNVKPALGRTPRGPAALRLARVVFGLGRDGCRPVTSTPHRRAPVRPCGGRAAGG